jgi:hypothetical protein
MSLVSSWQSAHDYQITLAELHSSSSRIAACALLCRSQASSVQAAASSALCGSSKGSSG